ncbi:MAG: hypothetical protein GF417_11985 [Candidatus Latescibacteria bacterium]|nr:hypothetical protein [bacterium]MBD3425146.1 hypothetical protein [Candidatus Latescibacterota bacterium]
MRFTACSITGSWGKYLAALSAGTVILALYCSRPEILTAIPLMAAAIILLRTPHVIIYFVTVIIFMRLDTYISYTFSLPFGKVMAAASILCLLVILFLTGYRVNSPGVPVLLMGCFFLSYFAIGMLNGSGAGIFPWLEEVVLSLVCFFTVYLLVNSYRRVEMILLMILLVGLVVSVVNVYEFINPSFEQGRSAGLIENPNSAGFVVDIGMTASLYFLWIARKKKQVLLILLLQLILFFGVFTTFSRGGILIFALIFALQLILIKGKVKRMIMLTVSALVIAAGIAGAVRFINTGARKSVRHSFNKVATLARGEVDDNMRFYLLNYHLQRFYRHPLTGNGLYTAKTGSESEPYYGVEVPNGPHNTVVFILSEAGIIPAVIYLVFLLALFRNLASIDGKISRKVAGMKLCLMVGFLVFLAEHIFSHQIFLMRYPMVLIALFALPLAIFHRHPLPERVS